MDGLSLRVERGACLVLLGPSGCGKTTTLNLVAGFLRPDAGSVWLDGQDITGLPPHRRDMGMVFQDYALFPHMTLRDNVGFGPETRFAARFIGGCNLLPGHVAGRSGGMVEVMLADGVVLAPARADMLAADVVLAVRPHRMRLDPVGPLRRRWKRWSIWAR